MTPKVRDKVPTMGAEVRLQELGVVLPAAPAAGGNYVALKTVGSLVYLSGVLSSSADGVVTGTAGSTRSIEEGYAAARLCALAHLAILRSHLGSLDRVREVVSLNGYVSSAPGFAEAPRIVDGASDLLVEIFGEAGRHVRAAIGVSALPRNALVETQMVIALQQEEA